MEQIPVAVSPTNPSWRVRLAGWVIQYSKVENREKNRPLTTAKKPLNFLVTQSDTEESQSATEFFNFFDITLSRIGHRYPFHHRSPFTVHSSSSIGHPAPVTPHTSKNTHFSEIFIPL